MAATLEEIKARYNRVEKVADSVGRIIGVRKLRISQQLLLNEMTPLLDGTSELSGPDGTKIEIPRRTYPLLAASVVEVDGVPIPFPKSRAELNAAIDMLDEPGLLAVVTALAALDPAPEGEGGAGATIEDRAKK